MNATRVPAMVRCERCLGMGYKGRTERGSWKIRNCYGCGGSGQRPPTRRDLARMARDASSPLPPSPAAGERAS